MAKSKTQPPWIPMRVNLDKDPVVIELAQLPDIGSIDAAIGKLWRFWSWVYLEVGPSRRGIIRNVTLDHIDTLVASRGFASCVTRRAYLKAHASGGIEIPNYNRWFPESVKYKADAAKRARDYRARKRDAASRDALRIPESTGPDRRVHNKTNTGTGAGAIETRGGDRTGPDRRRGPKTEQRNALAAAIHRENVGADGWVQIYLSALAEACRLSGAEYNAQRDALAAVATRISQHPERAEIGAELIMLAQSKRMYVAKHGGNPWALWQKATEAFLKSKGV